MMAVLQADALLVYQYVNNRSDIIVSKGSDFPALVDPRCLMMCGFKYKQGKGKNINKEEARCMIDIKIGGECNKKLETLKDRLSLLLFAQSIKWNKANFPVL
eukprot:431218-Ditylum_brightwellii.AAC.1